MNNYTTIQLKASIPVVCIFFPLLWKCYSVIRECFLSPKKSVPGNFWLKPTELEIPSEKITPIYFPLQLRTIKRTRLLRHYFIQTETCCIKWVLTSVCKLYNSVSAGLLALPWTWVAHKVKSFAGPICATHYAQNSFEINQIFLARWTNNKHVF